jgi:hypothetical protein
MKQEEKSLTIESQVGFKIILTTKGYEISYDQTNEHNLAAFMIVDQVMNDNIQALQLSNVYTPKQKKEKKDRVEKLRKLKLELVNCMAEVAQYLLATKNQEDYNKKKSKIKLATKEDAKKLNLIKP